MDHVPADSLSAQEQSPSLTLPSQTSDPTWEIAYLFPRQGEWSEEAYLALDTNRLVEFVEGHLEVLAMPTQSHQRIVAYLYRLLASFVIARELGEVLFAPFRIRLQGGKYREPDIAFMLAQHADRQGEQFWEGADLVMEVVSPDDPRRDWEVKRAEYAAAGITEYWIVDPRDESIHVLALSEGAYRLHGTFTGGGEATSLLLQEFTADVAAIFAAAER